MQSEDSDTAGIHEQPAVCHIRSYLVGVRGGVVVRGVVVLRGVGPDGAGPFAGGAGTPELALYASTMARVMSVCGAANSTLLCCPLTSSRSV